MKETKRITKLFIDLYDGHPWIDVNIVSTLAKLTASQASIRVLSGCNTIWEIVNHIIAWRSNVLKRLDGKVVNAPSHNYFQPVKTTSDSAWKNTLSKLEKSQQEWLAYLEKVSTKDFDNVYPISRKTYYEHILGIVQHDAYHLGQISLLVKLTFNI